MRSNKQQKKGCNHTMIIGALTKLTYTGVLAVLLLACAGAAAGATWVVDDDGEAEWLNTYDKINYR